MRVDKYLWCIRVFKTRSLASQACRTNKVYLEDKIVKSSKEVVVGNLVKVRKGPVWFHYEVVALPKNRLGAKLVVDYAKDLTPQEELDKLEILRLDRPHQREKGSGRPTKKERRDLDQHRKI